ncbi:MAG TPA: ABC transporter substrate-binding protein [Chloroflexota bacterium]|nr:ABC transporter substrate-binding protein [Chloroflexota bacterium]
MHAWSFLALAVSALALAACGGSTPAATPATSTAAAASAKPAASVAASASPAASAPASASAKPAASGAGGLVTVKVGNSSASPTNGGEYVANGLGFFEKQGIKIEHVTFNAASAVAPALATGEVDVADVGVNPAMFNTMAAALGAKVVADKGYAPPGFGSASVLVRKDLADKVKGPADFKGLNMGMTPPGLGTSAGYALTQWLAIGNVTPNDVHIQPLAFPEQPAALSNKALDAAMTAEPFATQAINAGFAVRLTTWDKMVPNQQIAGYAYSAKFIQNRDAATKWMTAYVQGIRAYDDAFLKNKDKDQIIEIMAKETPIKDVKLWGQMIPAGLNPNGKLNVKSIEEQEEFFKKLNLIAATTPAPSTFIDESFSEAAARQLGPYS